MPWAMVFGLGVAVFGYWSALCWAVAFLRRKPLVSGVIVAAATLLAVAYPLWDQASYRGQQAQAIEAGRLGIPPDWTDTTALLIVPHRDECKYECWNLATGMEARVVLLLGEAAQAVDFSAPVDLTALPLQELLQPEGPEGPFVLQEVTEPVEIDHVLLHSVFASPFDGAFDALRPRGIPPSGFSIDAMIVPVVDPKAFDLAADPPALRLVHVSRNLAEIPFVPFHGRLMYWNNADRRANFATAQDYFCSSASRDPHWCFNGFD